MDVVVQVPQVTLVIDVRIRFSADAISFRAATSIAAVRIRSVRAIWLLARIGSATTSDRPNFSQTKSLASVLTILALAAHMVDQATSFHA